MKGLLVRVGIDQSYGEWNAPCRVDGSFCYVPMQPITPEHQEARFITTYDIFAEPLQAFGAALPAWLVHGPCHLDPDFNYLTYGDAGQRANRITTYFQGSTENFIAFYASLASLDLQAQTLVYALIGLYRFSTVSVAAEVPEQERHCNAHTRLVGYRQGSDILVVADRAFSGRLKQCIPIGEYRNRAYRVRQDLLSVWGGISSNDGYIQRSAYLPHFCEPQRFLQWFESQNPELVALNNPPEQNLS